MEYIFFANMGCLVSSYMAGALVVDPKYDWDNRNFSWGKPREWFRILGMFKLMLHKKLNEKACVWGLGVPTGYGVANSSQN